jgi:hypothetical protein
MYFRQKKSGSRTYLQIVESYRQTRLLHLETKTHCASTS